MGVRLRNVLAGQLDHLRYEPVTRRVRAEVDGSVVVDSDRAVLVWEPRRVVPTYAVPVGDVLGEVVPLVAPATVDEGPRVGFAIPDVTDLPVLDPRIPFAVRLTDGESVEIRAPGLERTVQGFRPSDPCRSTMFRSARQPSSCAGVRVVSRPCEARCSTARSQRRVARGRRMPSLTTRPATVWRMCGRRTRSLRSVWRR